MALAPALTVALLAPQLALARAGSGQHGGAFGGGGLGGGGFSGGGFGGGFGSGFFFLPFFGFGGGSITLVIIVAVAFVVLRGYIGDRLGGSETFRDATGLDRPDLSGGAFGAAAPVEEGLAALRAADPGFDADQFLDRAQMAFFQLQKAWQDRNVDEGRSLLSTGLYMSWRAQVDQITQEHKRNVLENLNVQGMHIARAEHTGAFDHVTVRIDAVAADYEIDDTSGKVVFGDRHDRPFAEYWTFTRSAGVKTAASGGVLARVCPNCGAPLTVNEVGECDHCRAAVTSGQFDWVLSKIDQAQEWRP